MTDAETCFLSAAAASLRVPGVDSDDETKTPSPSPHHGRSRPPSLIADSSSESDEGDARGEVRSSTVILNIKSSYFFQTQSEWYKTYTNVLPDVWHLRSNGGLHADSRQQRLHLSKGGSVCWSSGFCSSSEVVSSYQAHKNNPVPPRLGLTCLPGQKTQGMKLPASACCKRFHLFLTKFVFAAFCRLGRSSWDQHRGGLRGGVQEEVIVREAPFSAV